LEVQAFVVDRPALVRLEVETLVDAADQLFERALAGLEMEVRHPDERHPAPVVGSHRAAGAAPDLRRGLARGEEAAERACRDDRLAPGRNALVVEAEGAEAAGRRRVGGDVHVLGAIPQGAEVLGLEEARPRVGSLGAVDAVELGRVPDRFVHLELHLLGVDHQRRHLRGAGRR
jgi:hypothetical protein